MSNAAGVERDRAHDPRRAWVRIDSLALDPDTADLLVLTAGRSGWSLVIDSDEPSGWLAVIDDSGGGGPRIGGFVGRWRGSDREHVRRGSSEPEQMLAEVLQALDQEDDSSRPRRVSVGVEVLVERALEALRHENSRLRLDLAAAEIRVEFLETALHQLSEAKATGRRRLMVGGLKWVVSILAVAGAEVAGTALGATVAGPPNVHVEITQPAPSAASALDFVHECEALLVDVEALPDRLPRP